MSNSLRPHESQHARLPCPSRTPRVYSNSCPSSRWCHPAISSSAVPFSSCPQSLLASGSFPTSQLFAWGGQSIGVLASASVLPMNTQDWSPLGWTGWISLLPYKSLTPKQCSFRIPVTHSTNISVLEFWKMNIKAREILLILILALFKGSVITTSEVCTLCLI